MRRNIQGGHVKCWGSNLSGQTGLGGDRTIPGIVTTFNDVPTKIFAGPKSTCTIWGTGDSVQCLGDSTFGQLSFSGIQKAVLISAGSSHACLVKADGVRCAGDNTLGQLGNETNTASSSLMGVAMLEQGSQVTHVSAGETHTCAIAGKKLYCWGDNSMGQLGNGNNDNQNIPTEVTLPGQVTAVSAGNRYSCASTSTQLYCWGNNDKGQLGDGTLTNRLVPTLVSLIPSVQAIQTSGAGQHTCAVAQSAVYCWGKNAFGQLGAGTLIDSSVPKKVATLF